MIKNSSKVKYKEPVENFDNKSPKVNKKMLFQIMLLKRRLLKDLACQIERKGYIQKALYRRSQSISSHW